MKLLPFTKTVNLLFEVRDSLSATYIYIYIWVRFRVNPGCVALYLLRI